MIKQFKELLNNMLVEKELYRIMGKFYYEPLILKYDIKNVNKKIIIPIYNYSFLEIIWDEDTINNKHYNIFKNTGQYIVKVYSDAKQLNYETLQGCHSLSNVISYGTHDFININFSDCIYLESVPNYLPSKISSTKKMFYNCYILNCDLSNFNTQNINDMSNMFSGCFWFDNDISNFDTSNVTDMSNMFDRCHRFNRYLNNFNTSKVKTMAFMFFKCYKFNQQLNNFDTSKVLDMSGMFYQCSEFNKSLDNFNTSKVINMSCMFAECYEFNQKLNFDTSNVINTSRMFDYCTQLAQDFSHLDMTKNVDDTYMFYGTQIKKNQKPNKKLLN